MNQNFRFLLMLLLACLILGNGVLLTGQAQSPVVSDDVDEPDGPDLTGLTSPGLVPLVRRHPYAGVYSVWDGELKGRDLDNYPFLKGVHLYTKWATLKPDQNGPYRWELLDQVVREKTGGDDDVRLYLQVNAHWPDWIFDHIAISTFSKRDQRIPQFWDPLYLGFYQQFIRDLAAYIAQAPYKDRIVLVRAQFNAFTPESISPDGYFSYQTYLPTAGGHRYPVNYNYTLGDRYARAVTQTYLEAFTPLGILVVQKPFSNTGHDQTIAAEYAGMGAGLFATNNGPNPLRRQTIYRLSTSLQTRSFSEPGRLGHCVNQPSEDKLRFIYWSALSALHHLLLDPAGDDDDIFHMVEITRGGVASRADEDSLELAPEAESLPQLPLEADPDEPLFPPDPASPEPLPAEPTTEPPTPTETPLPDAALETPLPIETALFMEISLPLITPAAEAAASATLTFTPEPPPTETATSSPEPTLTATPTAETAASATPTLTPEPPPTETATPSPTDTPSPIPQPTTTPTLAVTPAP